MTPQEQAREPLERHGIYTVIPVRNSEKWCVFDVIMGDATAICPDRPTASKIADALSQPASPDMVSVPEGYVLVPTEPTEPMIMASGNTENRARDDWRRMLSRAPKDTTDEQG